MNKNHLAVVTFILVFSSVGAGCNSTQSVTPTKPTLTTQESTALPAVTNTINPTSTSTLVPTSTVTPVPLPTNTQTPEPTPSPGDSRTREKDGMTMVLIPSGTFKMGSLDGYKDTKPVHDVTLDSFWMDESEVTNAMYRLCVDATVCAAPKDRTVFDDGSSADVPVTFVNWDNATAYCDWVGGRLPTEAEWEYAGRGGLEQKLFSWGDEKPVCEPGAPNGAQNTECSVQAPIKVKTFQPNGYHLYDMAGNVFEWVSDWYDSEFYKKSPVKNPQGPETGKYRGRRGGSWVESDFLQHVAPRNWDTPDTEVKDIGFRCVSPDVGKD